jgi:hypothetical protein
MKTLEERYGDEILIDNTALDQCRQCKDCAFQSDGTIYTNDYRKGSCAKYKYPKNKPFEVMENRVACPCYRNKDEFN